MSILDPELYEAFLSQIDTLALDDAGLGLPPRSRGSPVQVEVLTWGTDTGPGNPEAQVVLLFR